MTMASRMDDRANSIKFSPLRLEGIRDMPGSIAPRAPKEQFPAHCSQLRPGLTHHPFSAQAACAPVQPQQLVRQADTCPALVGVP